MPPTPGEIQTQEREALRVALRDHAESLMDIVARIGIQTLEKR